MKGRKGWVGGEADDGRAMPAPDACDPGPMSQDSYGHDPAPRQEFPPGPAAGRAVPYACRHGCMQPDGVCVKLKRHWKLESARRARRARREGRTSRRYNP